MTILHLLTDLFLSIYSYISTSRAEVFGVQHFCSIFRSPAAWSCLAVITPVSLKTVEWGSVGCSVGVECPRGRGRRALLRAPTHPHISPPRQRWNMERSRRRIWRLLRGFWCFWWRVCARCQVLVARRSERTAACVTRFQKRKIYCAANSFRFVLSLYFNGKEVNLHRNKSTHGERQYALTKISFLEP